MADPQAKIYQVQIKVTSSPTGGAIDGGAILATDELTADCEVINPGGGEIHATILATDEIHADVEVVE